MDKLAAHARKAANGKPAAGTPRQRGDWASVADAQTQARHAAPPGARARERKVAA